MNERGIVHDTTELRKLIAENPDLPIVVAVGEYAWSGDYGYECCTNVSCEISVVLDCETPFNSEYIFTDEDYFVEQLADYLTLSPKTKTLTDKEFDKLLKEEIAKYKPYWKKVITITADN